MGDKFESPNFSGALHVMSIFVRGTPLDAGVVNDLKLPGESYLLPPDVVRALQAPVPSFPFSYFFHIND